MKRSTRYIKKALVTFLVVLMSINTFAAVVGDNDGAAFITKAEFDSLKNDFQSQLDRYNSSIDNKIDGAIANYLSGVKVSAINSDSVILKNWGSVSMMNYPLENVWQCPELNLAYTIAAHTGTITGTWRCNWWLFAKILHTRDSAQHCRRLLCDAGSESATTPAQITWGGYAMNLVEVVNAVKNEFIINSSEAGLTHLLIDGANHNEFGMVYALTISHGFFSNLYAALDFYTPSVFWWGWAGGTGKKSVKSATDKWVGVNSLSITLEEVGGTAVDYNHVLNWDNLTYGNFTDVDWLRTFSAPTESGAPSRKQMQDTASITGVWEANTTSNTSDLNPRKEVDGAWIGNTGKKSLSYVYTGGIELDDTSAFGAVGLLPRTYDSENILQFNDDMNVTLEKTEFTVNKVNLLAGIPLVAGLAGDKINVTLEFDNCLRNGVAEANMPICVYLAMEPFGESDTVLDENNRIHCEGQGTAVNYMETIDNKVTLTWDMPKDGIVYVKWRPKDTSGEWRADLNLAKNSIYTYQHNT